MTIDRLLEGLRQRDPRAIGRAISLVENGDESAEIILSSLDENLVSRATILGITGPPGAGKSTLTNEIIAKLRHQEERIGIIAIDPSSPISGGAILGDRIRMMQHATDKDVVMRSMATRGRLGGLCATAGAAVRIMASCGCSTIIIETVGVGQSEMDIIRLADITILVMAPGLGDEIQAMKAGLLEVADILVVNKADCKGADILAMDLEAVTRKGSATPTQVCMTVATEGKGVTELLDRIDKLDSEHRDSGERQKRRRGAHNQEVLDWCLEILRPQLLDKIIKRKLSVLGDPRLKAKKILEEK
ncbi:MAG: methylmalonyl Co-A mutase-associated GTPase MeaB [Desulfobacterales bacterium]|jgi:GTPase|nr:methylmalonyl Co-A mutase-associated GTPase MeaB [Desulfobacterales bacterium]